MATKKKQKLNRRFVIIVGSFVLLGMVVVGGLAYIRIAGAAERNKRLGDAEVALGDEALAAGDLKAANEHYRDAVDRYGRAVSKKPNSVNYVDQMLVAVQKIRPESSSEADERWRQVVSLRERRTSADKNNPQVWLDYLATLRDQARMMQDPGAWKMVVTAADNMRHRLPEDAPAQLDGKLFHGEAQVFRGGELTPQERIAAREELQEVLVARPEEARAWAALLRSISDEATRLDDAQLASEAAAEWQQFDTALAQARAKAPQTVSMATMALRQALKSASERPGDEAAMEPAYEAARTVVELGAKGDSWDLLEAASAVIGIRDESVTEPAIAALQAYLATDPDALLHQRILGLLQRHFDPVAAQATLKAIATKDRVAVGMVGAFQDEVRASSADILFDLAFDRWAEAENDEERAAALKELQSLQTLIEEIVRGRGGESLMQKVEGKIAYASGNWQRAASRLGAAARSGGRVTPDVYLYAAQAEARLGELGAATITIDRGIEEYPGDVRLQIGRATLALRLGRAAEARMIAEAILRELPAYEPAKQILAQATGGSVFEAPDQAAGDDRVSGLLAEADRELLAGKPDRALELLRVAEAADADVRLRRAILHITIRGGDAAQIAQELAASEAAFPGDSVIMQMRVIASTTDPVERAILMAEGQATTPKEKASAAYVALSSVRSAALEQRSQTLDAARRASLDSIIASADAKLPAAKAVALEQDPANPWVVELTFREAAAANDAQAIEKALALAAKSEDPAMAPLLQGTWAMDQRDYPRAIASFEAVTRSPDASASAFRLLGVARERSGDVSGALEAYAESYRRRPNDPQTVELYGSLLGSSGDPERALEVLRAGARSMAGSEKVVNACLRMEEVVGNRLEALRIRQRILAMRPSDAENARRLAALLAEIPATPAMLVDAQGRPLFSAGQWVTLPAAQQQERLRVAREQNLQAASVIVAGLLKRDPSDIQAASLYAAALYRSGLTAEAEKVLADFLANAPAGARPRALFEIGTFYMERDRGDDAARSFAEAIATAPADDTDIPLSVSEFWFRRGDWAQSEAALEVALQRKQSVGALFRRSELQMRQQDFSAARASLADAIALGGGKVGGSEELLAASIAQAEGDAAWKAGQRDEAKAKFAEMDAALDRAMKLEPGDPAPFHLRALQRQAQWARTGDQRAMDEAIAAAQRAVELRGSYWLAVRTLADLLAVKGDSASAVGIVERYVRANPRHSDARRLYADLLAESNNASMGLATLQEAAADDPANPRWLQTIASYCGRVGREAEGAAALEKAYELTKNPAYLVRAVDLFRRGKDFDAKGLTRLLQAQGDIVQRDQYLAAAAASAMAHGETPQVGFDALRALQRTAANAPGGITGWLFNARAAFRNGETARYEQFVRDCCGSTDPLVLSGLAEAWLEEGDAGASRALEIAQEAKDLAEKAGASAEVKANVLAILGSARFANGDCAGARQAFGESLALRPDSVQVKNNLAYLEVVCGDPVRGLALAQEVVKQSPGMTAFSDTLGVAYLKTGDPASAQSILMRAVRWEPTASIWLHLAEAQKASGALEAARQSLARAKSLQQDRQTADQIREFEKSLP